MPLPARVPRPRGPGRAYEAEAGPSERGAAVTGPAALLPRLSAAPLCPGPLSTLLPRAAACRRGARRRGGGERGEAGLGPVTARRPATRPAACLRAHGGRPRSAPLARRRDEAPRGPRPAGGGAFTSGPEHTPGA